MGTTFVNGIEVGPDGKEWAKTEAGYKHVESVKGISTETVLGRVWHGHAVREAFVAGAEWQENRVPPGFPKWVKIGASFRIFGRRYHVRGFVDGKAVLREWGYNKQRWFYTTQDTWYFEINGKQMRRGKIKADEMPYRRKRFY